MITKKQILGICAVASIALGLSTASACTGIRLTAKDGSVIHARTLEFAVDVHSNVIMVPRGYERTGSAPKGKKGLKWTSKYASVGANGVEMPYIFDGLNEKGLAIGLFYHPTTAKYMQFKESDASKTIAPWEVGSWILENFASVQEVKDNISKIVVPEVNFPAWGFTPPVHYTVHDASGNSIVIEFLNGKTVVFDNPLGVLTNSPEFSWHMTNIRNYLNISLLPLDDMKLNGVTFKSFGMGAGLAGVPGDFTPPSRFVKAAIFSQAALPAQTGSDAVLDAFHLLNNFDIPKGTARDEKKDKHGNIVAEFTQWTSANDLKSKKFYFRTYDNSQIKSVDLTKMKLDAKKIITIPMAGKEEIKDITP